MNAYLVVFVYLNGINGGPELLSSRAIPIAPHQCESKVEEFRTFTDSIKESALTSTMNGVVYDNYEIHKMSFRIYCTF